MDYITAKDRLQLRITSLEDPIEADNPVRFVEAFVEKLDLTKLGYQTPPLKTEGRPPFQPKMFLKIYLYGYLNAIRSSRRLALTTTVKIIIYIIRGCIFFIIITSIWNTF